MNWIILIIGGLFEVAFTYCIGRANTAQGTEKYLWYLGFLISVSISMGLLIKASKTLPLGTAYAVWSGIGAVGSVTMGDRKSTRLNSSHVRISYAVFCLKK